MFLAVVIRIKQAHFVLLLLLLARLSDAHNAKDVGLKSFAVEANFLPGQMRIEACQSRD